MNIGVYLYGASLQLVKHSDDTEQAIQEVRDNVPENFRMDEDDILLCHFEGDNSDGKIIYNVKDDMEEA